MANGTFYRKELTEPGEVEELYQELDQIRLVFETDQVGYPKLVGWYRPDGDPEVQQARKQMQMIARMAFDMLE